LTNKNNKSIIKVIKEETWLLGHAIRKDKIMGTRAVTIQFIQQTNQVTGA
jgi:hypothetical protein